MLGYHHKRIDRFPISNTTLSSSTAINGLFSGHHTCNYQGSAHFDEWPEKAYEKPLKNSFVLLSQNFKIDILAGDFDPLREKVLEEFLYIMNCSKTACSSNYCIVKADSVSSSNHLTICPTCHNQVVQRLNDLYNHY